MECLYKVTTKFTFDAYKRFNNAIVKKKHIIPLLIVAVLLIILGGVMLKNLFLVIFGILYPFVFFFMAHRNIKKVYNSNKLLQNADVTYEFYEDCIYEKFEGGEAKVPYDKLDEIIETKTDFYLMIAKNQGFMIAKADMPEGLDSFLKGKKTKKK